jgi:MoxR-like ATPase
VSNDRIGEVLAQFNQARNQILEQIKRSIVGQSDVLEQILAAIFTRGHCLLVGVPGLAKTLMVSSISQILDVGFKRIQFTPDLMPTDITGTTVLDENEHGRREFRFVKGPIFSNILLADEINRTPPKTQAALLQAMQERQVTAGAETYNLPEPFFVIATQNPIEQEGTYPLPEAQLDRFMFNIKVDYPAFDEERRIIDLATREEQPEVTKVLSGRAILQLQKLVRSVPVGDYVKEYVTRLVRSTRPKDPLAPDFVKKMVDWGAGPRAGIFLVQGARAMAAMDGRFSVAIDDVKKIAVPILRHRVSTNFQAQAEGKTSDDVVLKLLQTVKEPEVEKYSRKKP